MESIAGVGWDARLNWFPLEVAFAPTVTLISVLESTVPPLPAVALVATEGSSPIRSTYVPAGRRLKEKVPLAPVFACATLTPDWERSIGMPGTPDAPTRAVPEMLEFSYEATIAPIAVRGVVKFGANSPT